MNSQLTTQEARAIMRAAWWCNVPVSLHRLAMAVLNNNKPIVTFEPINWFEDDGSDAVFDETMRVKSEQLQEAISRDVEFKNGGK